MPMWINGHKATFRSNRKAKKTAISKRLSLMQINVLNAPEYECETIAQLRPPSLFISSFRAFIGNWKRRPDIRIILYFPHTTIY